MSERNPSLAEVLGDIMGQAGADMRVSCPAEVVTFDGTKRKVSVQPSLKRGYQDETGARQSTIPPIISNVPVHYPSGGTFSITWPLAQGDKGWVIFADGSLDAWLASSGGVVDPVDDRAHSVNDAAFFPGVLPWGAVVQAVGTCLELGKDGVAREGVALGGTLATYLQQLELALAGLTATALTWTVPRPPVPTGLESTTVKVSR